MQQRTKGKTILLISIALLLWGGLAATFGIYDLQISESIVNKTSTWANLLEWFGEFIPAILITYSGVVLSAYYFRVNECKLQTIKIIASLICLFGGVGYFFKYVIEFNDLRTWIFCAIYLLSVLLLFSTMRYIKKETLSYLKTIALTAILLAIASALVVNGLKVVWGRMRFEDMTNPTAQFTPWYLPQGSTGNRSFPSGHTTSVSMLIVFSMFAEKYKHKLSKFLCYALPVISIVIMAYSRVVAGAHFCSDVLFAIGITLSLFNIIKHFTVKTTQS